MLLQDMALGREHVVLAVDRAGISGEDGETHQGSMDVSFLSAIPNMTVWSPASFKELRDMLRVAVETDAGPVAVRYPKGGEGRYTDGGAEPTKVLRSGMDFTLVTYGITVNAALEAAEALEKEGVEIEIIKLGRIKPLDMGPILESAKRTRRVLVAEESVEAGGVGERIAARLSSEGVAVRSLLLKNLGDMFLPQGTQAELRRMRDLDGPALARAITEELKAEKENGKDET